MSAYRFDFQKIIEHSPDLVTLTDLEGRVKYVNEAVTRILGYSREEYRSLPPTELIHPDDLPQALVIRDELLTTPGATRQLHARLRHRDGNWVWMATTANNFLDDPQIAAIVYHAQDISTLKYTSEELQLHSDALENSLNGFDIVDAEGRFVYANKAYLHMWGYERLDEILGTSPEGHCADPTIPAQIIEHLNRDGQYTLEFAARRKDGSTFDVLMSALLFDSPQKGRLYIGTTLDITGRKLAQKALQESEERFRLLYEQAPLAYQSLDVDGHFLEVNPKWLEMLGYPRQEVLGRWFGDFLPPEDQALFRQRFPYFKQRGHVEGVEFTLRRKDGSQLVAAFDGRIGQTIDGEFKQTHCILHDITERKEVEEALRASEEQFRSLFENAPVGIFYSTAGGKILQVNAEYARIMGYASPQELMAAVNASSVADILYVRPELRPRLVRRVQTLGSGWLKVENQYRRKDGSIVTANLIFRSLPQNPDLLEGFVEDISERKQAEEEIRQLNARLEQRVIERTAQLEASNREMEAFTYSVSHDLRAPLRAINGFSQLLANEYAPRLDPQGMRFLDIIRENTRKMDQLISDLLGLSRISRSELKYTLIDMTTLARRTFQEIAPADAGAGIDFRVSVLFNVYGDPGLIQQVWSNLLSNAIKYTQTRPLRKIEVGAYAQPGEVVYYVRDNGVGFDPQYSHKLFGVFQRLHSAEEFEGNGVGLAIVQRIIQRHGGRVWAEGQLGAGATFYFSLPLVEDHTWASP